MEVKTPSAPVTWLGVAARKASDEVLAQLPPEQAGGLLVYYVSKDSPAQKAGVQVNDVLTRLDDQILVHPDQLNVLIGSHKAGDPVKLSGYRHGKEFELAAKLESKKLPAEEAMKLGMPGSTVKEWNSVSSLPPDAQKIISEIMSDKGSLPISVTSKFTVIGPDGELLNSGTFIDPGVISQLLKMSRCMSSGSNTNADADTAEILKLLQNQGARQSQENK